jgi:hypothetical protein
MITGSNIDPVRAAIMDLENASVFDPFGWECVLAELRLQDRPAALVDAQRRLQHAQSWQVVETVSAETAEMPA